MKLDNAEDTEEAEDAEDDEGANDPKDVESSYEHSKSGTSRMPKTQMMSSERKSPKATQGASGQPQY